MRGEGGGEEKYFSPFFTNPLPAHFYRNQIWRLEKLSHKTPALQATLAAVFVRYPGTGHERVRSRNCRQFHQMNDKMGMKLIKNIKRKTPSLFALSLASSSRVICFISVQERKEKYEETSGFQQNIHSSLYKSTVVIFYWDHKPQLCMSLL